MKYGTRYCFGLPASLRRLLERVGEALEVVDRPASSSARSTCGSVCSGATFRWPPTWCVGQLAHVFGRQLGQVHADAAGDEHLADAGLRRGLCCISSTSGPWSVPSSLQIVGWTQDSRLHFASTSGRVQRIWYMLAVGPPMSLTTPENSGSAAILRTSLEHRFLRARLDDPPLVGRDRAERAAAEAAAHDRHRILDHLVGGDRLGVRSGAAGACRAGRRSRSISACGERQGRRVGDDGLAVVDTAPASGR